SGSVRVGDDVTVQPSGQRAAVASIHLLDERREVALAGDSVVIVLDRDLDVSRGDILAATASLASVAREFSAEVCWLDQQPLNPLRKYLLKQGTRLTHAKVQRVLSRRNVLELEQEQGEPDTLLMNEIGTIALQTRESLAYDPYDACPGTGAFILIDAATHQTAAAGMLR
ncbi:MAG: sulfate adenylyltransferase, partial [Burkholderiaceae bacterium]